MDIALMIIAGLLMLTGLVGCVLPVLPGVPLAYVGLLLLQLTDKVQFSTTFMLIWLAVVIVIQVLDYYVPAWGTKQFGGSKWGVVGSTLGLIAGLFTGPWGIVLGPFIGAVIGEWLQFKDWDKALKAGWGSFIGLLIGVVMKLVCCGLMIYYFFAAIFA